MNIDTDALKTDTAPKLIKINQSLSAASFAIESCKIPEDFCYYQYISSLPQDISDIKASVFSLASWIGDAIRDFTNAESQNVSLTEKWEKLGIKQKDQNMYLIEEFKKRGIDITQEEIDALDPELRTLYTSIFSHGGGIQINEINTEELLSESRTILNVENAFIASGINVGVAFTEGVGEFGEGVVDTALILDAGIRTVGTGMRDGITYAWKWFWNDLDDWESSTKAMWKNTMSFVAEEHVDNAYNAFYEEGDLGTWLDDNAYNLFKSDGIVYKFAEGTGEITSIVLTGGGSEALTIAAAGVNAFGKGTQAAWVEMRDSAEEGEEWRTPENLRNRSIVWRCKCNMGSNTVDYWGKAIGL